ncbi:MAG: regulatory protein RecX [Spirochaetia bacterium]|jgi:regulatory protein|nr:regulatory protein RecX [Spirochaetia bacterium]
MVEREREEDSSSRNVNISVSQIKERGTFIEIILSNCSSFFILPEDSESLDINTAGELSDSAFEKLQYLDLVCRAYSKALDILAFAPSSGFMLKQKLIKRGFSGSEIKEVIERLSERKILDDRQYAENWVSSRLVRNPQSPLMLKAALVRKGISRALAEDVLKDLTPDSDAYIEAFEKVFRKQMRRTGTTPEKIKISLARKGYPLSLINKYLDKADY